MLQAGSWPALTPSSTAREPNPSEHDSLAFSDSSQTQSELTLHQGGSDVNQDLAGEGSYHGKGIYDVRAFSRVLSGRFPEEWLLSHDLIEGAHVRVAWPVILSSMMSSRRVT